ncbi:hypothetical protein A3A39_01985 [Candidatus Kaiserbacteria bacterium RIFCSPLOWO2_01_FULL_54_13]|uniref:N-acetyltransferase domain-containing protein n=1 Tax=Candidatus Kaiserbacteria bacterium RIFCSPLOWO2_01_FULL_54_13 TaxID=1798512 RepID=A0A1F6F0H1_9BACT|nr:MAG: hypothetical protein A3A39_01985 [Candidatus Kaiserbacteria bacterium RIFCSPLOWO2_01_FULL_54_13]
MHIDGLVLERPGVVSVAFRLQFAAITAEFAERIPWFQKVGNLAFATNPVYFLHRLLGELDCHVTPYQIITVNPAEEFVGGVLHLSRSPEEFKDSRNTEIAKRLETGGRGYLTCLQVRPPFRGVGSLRVMRAALKSVLKEKGPAWGVISDRNLLRWQMRHFGATLCSPLVNDDGLWIVSFGGGVANDVC